MKFIFVGAFKGISSKSNKPYNMVRISDGRSTYTLSNPNDVDFSQYSDGDDIHLVFDVKPNQFKTELVPVIVGVE